MLQTVLGHWPAIIGFLVALLTDVTILVPSLKDNAVYKAVNGVLSFFKSKEV